MAFLHSLVRWDGKKRKGWCAPAELGEAAPHYISFVVPLENNRDFYREYACEIVTSKDGTKTLGTSKLVRQGRDSFLVRFGGSDVWFSVRPVPRDERQLPYIGKLGHSDFASLFVEIEPERLDQLDQLFNDRGMFIIGCEPFTHYEGIEQFADLAGAPIPVTK